MPDFGTLQAHAPQQVVPFRLTGWHVGSIALVFFLIVAGMNAVMMRHAFRTMPGLDARNGYDASQQFNTSIKDARIQAAREWHTELSVIQDGVSTLLTAAINDKSGKPISGMLLGFAVRHPATQAHDVVSIANEIAPGRYQITHPKLIGNRDIEIRVTAGEGSPPFILSRNRVALGG